MSATVSMEEKQWKACSRSDRGKVTSPHLHCKWKKKKERKKERQRKKVEKRERGVIVQPDSPLWSIERRLTASLDHVWRFSLFGRGVEGRFLLRFEMGQYSVNERQVKDKKASNTPC